MFYNLNTKKVVIAYRGTDLTDSSSILGDVQRDYNILIRNLEKDSNFKHATKQFRSVVDKYQHQGYSVNMIGHSLGGALATHVMKKFPSRLSKNFNYSHAKDLISLGARLSKDANKSNEQSIVIHTRVQNMINANNMDRLQTHFKEPELVKKVSTHWVPNLTRNNSMQYR